MMLNIVVPGDNWILDTIGREFYKRAKNDAQCKIYSRSKKRAPSDWTYFTHYNLFDGRHEYKKCAALFPHIEQANKSMVKRWHEVKKKVDWCVAMSEPWLSELPENKSSVIRLGLASHFIRPLKIGMIDKARPQNKFRKGRDLQTSIRNKFPDIEFAHVGGGLSDEALVKFIQSCDYILCTSRYEGGPMPLVEAIALGKPVICRNSDKIGYLKDVCPYGDIILYDDENQLELELQIILDTRNDLFNMFSWDNFTKQHLEIFNNAEFDNRN